MKIRILIAAGLLLPPGAAFAAAAERAVWTWEKDSYAMVESTAAAEDAIAFLKSRNINTIYLYADAFRDRNLIESRPELYRDFIRGLHLRGRKVVIGIETTPNEIKKVSFNHLAEADMERELALAERSFTGQPAFAGFVIHHFRGYRVWLESGQPVVQGVKR